MHLPLNSQAQLQETEKYLFYEEKNLVGLIPSLDIILLTAKYFLKLLIYN
jgi:hypothetical protein